MTTDVNPQVSGEAGEEGLPTPSFSDQATSSPSVDADAIVSKLLTQLEPIIEKKVQSTKDKRFSEIEKVLGGRSKVLAELEEQGVAIPKEVRNEIRMRELEERLNGQPSQPAQAGDDGSSQQKAAVTEAIAELKKYELSENDPEFLGLLRGNYKNRSDFDLAVQKHIVGKLKPQQPASPAGVVQPPATGNSTGTDVAAKIARLQEYQKSPTKYRAEIKKLTDELDAVNWGGLT